MKNNPEIYKIAKGFDKNPQNINKKGRPKKIYTILKEKGFSKDDINTAFGELIWYSLPELAKLYKDEKKPAIIRIVANQTYLALKKGDYTKIKEIMEHVIGKPTQKQEIETNNKTEIELKGDPFAEIRKNSNIKDD